MQFDAADRTSAAATSSRRSPHHEYVSREQRTPRTHLDQMRTEAVGPAVVSGRREVARGLGQANAVPRPEAEKLNRMRALRSATSRTTNRLGRREALAAGASDKRGGTSLRVTREAHRRRRTSTTHEGSSSPTEPERGARLSRTVSARGLAIPHGATASKIEVPERPARPAIGPGNQTSSVGTPRARRPRHGTVYIFEKQNNGSIGSLARTCEWTTRWHRWP